MILLLLEPTFERLNQFNKKLIYDHPLRFEQALSIVSERGIEADPAKVKGVVNLCRHLVTSKSCVVCRAGSSLWSQKLELDFNPFPVKTRTLFGGQSTKKKVFLPQTLMSAPVLSPPITYWRATPAFRVYHRRHFRILFLWQKTMTLGRKEKAIYYLRPCSQRLSTFSIWYWGEPAIKYTPKLSKRWKKHTLIYQTGKKKERRLAREST